MSTRSARWILAIVLASAACLAWSAAKTDSVTVDEPAHIVAGYASLVTGDFRLSPDHPPLARWLLALPLLARTVHWVGVPSASWDAGDIFTLASEFFERWNDGQELVRASRAVAIALFLALLLTVAWTASKLLGLSGAVLATTIVAFDPSWLAHGHLATVDVPFALASLGTLASGYRWLERPTRLRLALLAASFSAATLVKFSWPILVPALLAMAVAARARHGPVAVLRAVGLAGGTLAAFSLLAIWAAYGFRFAATAPGTLPGVHMIVLSDLGKAPPTDPEAAWESVLHDSRTAADRPGLTVPILRGLHDLRLLPEAYLYGIAYLGKSATNRAAYLRGEYSYQGFAAYFPWAFAVKTPLPTLGLFLAGLAAVGYRAYRKDGQWNPLAIGLGVFACVYALALAGGGLDLGYRHLLPVTAVLAIAAGSLAPARFSPGVRRPLGVALGLAYAWLALGTIASAPHWIGYFNEAVGGWRNGHLYLADSNLDWGQDLLRLRARLASEPPETTVWLSQAGDPPLPPGMKLRWLLGQGSHAPDPTPIGGGLYVISATDLLGVYRPLARAESWRDPRLLARFEQASEGAARQGSAGPETGSASDRPIDALQALRRLRLVSRLALRAADERIGTSLFLFRLSDQQVEEWTAP